MQGGGWGLSRGMITYVQCLSSGPVVSSCWDKACYEGPPGKKRTLCSIWPGAKMGNSLRYEATGHPYPRAVKPEGCLRKRLLSVSKVHQKQDSLWTPKPMLGPVKKGLHGTTTDSQDTKGTSGRKSGCVVLEFDCLYLLPELMGWWATWAMCHCAKLYRTGQISL